MIEWSLINKELKQKGKDLTLKQAQQRYDTETLQNIAEASLVDGETDPNKMLKAIAKNSGTTSLKKLSELHGYQDKPDGKPDPSGESE